MRVQEISGKDVHNMKARIQHLRGPGGAGLCRGSRELPGGVYGFCAGGSSRTNGSGYPLSVPAVAHPPCNCKVRRGRLNLPKVSNTPPQVRRTIFHDTLLYTIQYSILYTILYTVLYIILYIIYHTIYYILYSTCYMILYYIVLYYIILYFTI